MSWDALTGDVEECAKEAAANWRQFESFAWHNRPEDCDSWFIFYTHNRDSSLCDESNAAAIAKELEVPEYENDLEVESHNHWACGWIDGYSVRVYDAQGNITPVFRKVCELATRLADYPLLDEEDHSQREYDATLENIHNEGYSLVSEKDDKDELWEKAVFSWLWSNNQEALESQDDNGGYPNKDEIKEALIDLGLLKEESLVSFSD